MNIPPDKAFSKKLADIMLTFAQEIHKETSASGIRISCEFMFRNGFGNLKMQTFTTPDSKTERILDVNKLMPRGTKLSVDAHAKMRSVVKKAVGRNNK